MRTTNWRCLHQTNTEFDIFRKNVNKDEKFDTEIRKSIGFAKVAIQNLNKVLGNRKNSRLKRRKVSDLLREINSI